MRYLSRITFISFRYIPVTVAAFCCGCNIHSCVKYFSPEGMPCLQRAFHACRNSEETYPCSLQGRDAPPANRLWLFYATYVQISLFLMCGVCLIWYLRKDRALVFENLLSALFDKAFGKHEDTTGYCWASTVDSVNKTEKNLRSLPWCPKKNNETSLGKLG